MPLHQRINLFCNFCKRPGHQDSQCYSKAKNFQRGPPTDRLPNQVNRTQVESSCTNKYFERSQEIPDAQSQETMDPESLLFKENSI